MAKRRHHHRIVALALTAVLAGVAFLVWWMLQNGRLLQDREIRSTERSAPTAASDDRTNEEFTAAERQSLEDILKQHHDGASR